MVLPTATSINNQDFILRHAHRTIWCGQSLNWNSFLRRLWAVSCWQLKLTRTSLQSLCLHPHICEWRGSTQGRKHITTCWVQTPLWEVAFYRSRSPHQGSWKPWLSELSPLSGVAHPAGTPTLLSSSLVPLGRTAHIIKGKRLWQFPKKPLGNRPLLFVVIKTNYSLHAWKDALPGDLQSRKCEF